MEGLQDHEQLLSLGLAIVINYGRERKMKRKRMDRFLSLDTNGVSEGKIFSFLEIREIMLKEKKTGKGNIDADGKGLHLIHLLLTTATSLDENKLDLAILESPKIVSKYIFEWRLCAKGGSLFCRRIGGKACDTPVAFSCNDNEGTNTRR
ncbi:unnamed protein product [Lactuca virosa]|uniref:Uncharacterized protein n=1 Tax=Lactuca virosa TaxID=75947 RepID=A0AAU9PU05_9ASTR|nr:unnamed protein product [Lactuca virosa]